MITSEYTRDVFHAELREQKQLGLTKLGNKDPNMRLYTSYCIPTCTGLPS